MFLDESTSAMDEGLELMLYRLLRAELPDTILVSVSHRDTVEQHHDRQLELLGDGAWRLDRLVHRRVDPSKRLPAAGRGTLPGMDMFTPTLDWGNEWLTSLWWIAKAWAIAAVATMVVLVLIGRFTTWGRQFWRITGAYFTGRASIKVWALAGGAAAVGDHRRAARRCCFSYQGNDLSTSFQVVAAGLGERRRGGQELRRATASGCRSASSASWRPSTSRGSCWTCS